MSKNILLIGAGKTGRGFLARLLAGDNSLSLTLIDQDAALIDRLRKHGQYTIRFFGSQLPEITVSGFRACTWKENSLPALFALPDTTIFVSVGGQNLENVGLRLGTLLQPEHKYCIITAENASHPARTLKDTILHANPALQDSDLLVSESTVFCTTTSDGELDILSECYPYLQCNADLLCGYDPALPGIRPISGFSDFLTRKLYTYNAASCVIAYLGWRMGYEVYADAANDPEIAARLDLNYEETNRAMCLEFGYEKEDQESFALLSRKKFCDRSILDTVERNARDPKRKLKGGERIIGPAQLMYKYGLDASVLEETAAAAILYSIEKEGENADCAAAEKYLSEICGLDKEELLYRKILEQFCRMTK